MTMHNTHTLYTELSKTLAEIDKQIEGVKRVIKRQFQSGVPIGVAITPEAMEERYYTTTDSRGRPLLIDLLGSRATIISAMSNLKAADMNVKGPKR